MRPTFLGFETGRRALMAAQKGLDIAGHNMSNSDTQGYTRQRVDQYSIYPPVSSYRYSAGLTSTAGHGVGISGIGQIRDPFLDNHFRLEYQEYSRLGTMTDGLDELESIFDEITSSALTENFDEMYAQLQKLSTDANRPEYANILLSKSKDVAFIFNTFSKDLAKMQEKQKFELDTNVSKVNDITAKIASINKLIRDEYITISSGGSSSLGPRVNEHYGPNELLDDRNLLLDELSSLVNIKTKTNNDGTVDVEMGDMMLVKGNEHGKLNVSPETGVPLDKNTQFSLTFSGRNTKDQLVFQEDLLNNANGASLTSGALKGYMQTLTGKGSYAEAGENNSFNGIPYYKGIIDSFAKTFSEAFNKANSYSEGTAAVGGKDVVIRGQLGVAASNQVHFAGTTPGGTAGAEWDASGKLVITLAEGHNYTARDINLMIENAGGTRPATAVGFQTYFEGEIGVVPGTMLTPTTMTDVIKPLFNYTDANGVADAGNVAVNEDWLKDPLGYLQVSKDLGSGDTYNNNILAMIKIFDTNLNFEVPKAAPATPVTEFNGNFKGYIKYYTGKLGQDFSFYQGLAKNKGSVASGIEDKRAGVSSVSLNDEGVDIMNFSNALNAASRFVTTLDEALNTIINNMGIVGK